MYTMFGVRSANFSSFNKYSTCSTISPGSRLRRSPAIPVAQNEHCSGQPAWDDTQSVMRLRSRNSTDSTVSPPDKLSKTFFVPLAAD